MSLLGKITTSHLTFTKANSEIEPIIKHIKEIRTQNKTGNLLRYETDNVNGDAILKENYFPSLQIGMIRYSSTKDNNEFPTVIILDSEYIYFREKKAVEQWSIAMSNSVRSLQAQILIGLDCE